MRSKNRRPGKRRASFAPKKRIWAKVAVLILLLCTITVPLMYASSTVEAEPDQEQRLQSEPINITIPKPCKTGIVTVYAQGQVIYQYGGEISIRNDGKNGEEIEIVVEYPDEWRWPCSCFEEE